MWPEEREADLPVLRDVGVPEPGEAGHGRGQDVVLEWHLSHTGQTEETQAATTNTPPSLKVFQDTKKKHVPFLF